MGSFKPQVASIFFLQFFNSAKLFEAVTAKKLPINTWLQNLLRLPPNISCGMIAAYDSNSLVFMTSLHGMLPSTQQSSTADTLCLNSTVLSIFFFIGFIYVANLIYCVYRHPRGNRKSFIFGAHALCQL